jgi:hypothetical protein
MDDRRLTPHVEALRPGPDVLENDVQTLVRVAVVIPSVDDDQPEDEPHVVRTLDEYHTKGTSLVARIGTPYWEA